MDKLVFRKLASDITVFFVISSISVALIVWILQAVNLLDIISDDGHDLKIYFAYVLLGIPNIYSKIIIFVFFISVFYIVNKYNENNEILVFWINGIKKIEFINFIFKISIVFLIIQTLFTAIIVPYSENLRRVLIKNSDVNFFPTLISEKKFINVFKNLTFFVENYDSEKSELKNIFIKEKINKNETKVIVAEKGIIVKKDNAYNLILFNGSISTNNQKNVFKIKFEETNYDLSNFNSKTTTYSKLKHFNSILVINCFKFILDNKFKHLESICYEQGFENIKIEIYERFIFPFFIIITALISSLLILKPKQGFMNFSYKFQIFALGFILSIFAQSGSRFTFTKSYSDHITFTMPFLLIFAFYLILIFKSKFKIGRL